MSRRFILSGFVLLLGILTGCSGGSSNRQSPNEIALQYPESDPLVFILKHRKDTASTDVTNHLSRAFDYTKIPFRTIDLDLLAAELEISSSVRLVCLTTSVVKSLNNREIEELVRFVGNGGNLLVTTPVWDPRFSFLLGIKPFSDYKRNEKTQGFEFNKTVFPGFENGSYRIPVPLFHKGLDGSVFTDSVDIIAVSKDNHENPVLIENDVGEGTVMLFNSLTGYDKDYRGLMFSISARFLKGVAFPVANVSTIFLDDFPAPLYDTKMSPIDWEYDKTHAEFVTQEWWPDMRAFADTFDIDYSTMLTFNYNANVVPPFDFNEWTGSTSGSDKSGSIEMAKSIAESRHELGFHGYNHFSLWEEDWPNREFMIASLQAARKRWQIDGLGPLPVTYVPPTNIIDSTGISALEQGMPQIQYLASLYLGTEESGSGREFSPDPYSSQLYDYPRITSGFIDDDNSKFKQHSVYILSGIWTHFIHPDDVFEVEQSREDIYPSRNVEGLGWHRNRERDYGLYEVFRKRVINTIDTYPFIRFKTAKDAIPIVKSWETAKLQREQQNERWLLNYSFNRIRRAEGKNPMPAHWFMYVGENDKEELKKQLDDEVAKLHFSPWWDGHLAQFASYRDTLVIPDLSGGHVRPADPLDGPLKQIVEKYRNYRDPETYLSGEEWQDNRLEEVQDSLEKNPGSVQLQNRLMELSVEFGRLELAIDILERRLLENSTWKDEDLEKLVTYYGWTGAFDRAWKFLEQLWSRYGSQSVIDLKDRMTAEYGVPDNEFRNRWLKRALFLQPGDERLLQKLIYANQGIDNWQENKKRLRKLIDKNPRSDTLYFYMLGRSFWYERPDSTLKLLESFPAHANQQLSPFAKDIAYHYAYSEGNYSEALAWADRTDKIRTATVLEWLVQQKRYAEFKTKARSFLDKYPNADSTRAFVGRQLIYEGFYDEGYEVLYPLFSETDPPPDLADLIHTEIGYQSYQQKKQFYRKYPDFFSDSLHRDLKHRYRAREGVKAGTRSGYASDNFNNTLFRIGLYTEWGEEGNYRHSISLDEQYLGSTINDSSLTDQLAYIGYSYQNNFRQQTMQYLLEGGAHLSEGEIRPQLSARLWYVKGSSFTSGRLDFVPVLTNLAVRQSINRFKATLYREDYWWDDKIQTSLNLLGSRYSDDVTTYEGTGRLFYRLSFSSPTIRVRPVAELAFLDASESRPDGIPYWTADRLFIKGAGVDFRYQKNAGRLPPGVELQLQLIGKHDSRDGFYVAGMGSLNIQLKSMLEFSINADISSSEVYQYNNIGFSFSYTFPKKLK